MFNCTYDTAETEVDSLAFAPYLRDALAIYRRLRAAGSVEFRFHRKILYNSIYRADDQVLVNTPLLGVTPSVAPGSGGSRRSAMIECERTDGSIPRS